MRLGDLLPETSAASADIEIAGVSADSRAIAPGFLFVAIPGVKANGARFIADAAARGAVAIVAQALTDESISAPVIITPDARAALSTIAARFYPRQPETIVAITGTSGKTSVAEFTRQIFAACGRKSASLGTLGIVRNDGAHYGSLTTPDPVTLHKTLSSLADEGITHLAMEASSHGLHQRRLDGVRLAAGAFTNLGRDHLDYHRDADDYLEAKMRLFETLLPAGAAAVVNLDGERGEEVASAARRRLRTLTVGRRRADIQLLSAVREGFGQRLSFTHADLRLELLLPLVGVFQVENALVAAGLALAVGEKADSVFEALAHLEGVPGRLEKIGEARGGLALVDYAHKPDALAAALDAVRPFVSGKLTVVFGCGGDRDRGKRALMGAIAEEKADAVIVTDDNPRSEQPADIRRAILNTAPRAREIGDRAEAIHTAISAIGPGDVVVVAGKGHETGQIVGDRTLPFSDHEVVRAALAEIAA